MKSDSTLKVVLLLVLCTFFWGSTFPVAKHVLNANEIHALTLVFWRFAIATICLAIYLKMNRIAIPVLSWKQWLWVITVSSVGVGGLNLCLFTGLTYTSATNSALIMSLSPLVTSLIACVALRTLPTYAQRFSLAMCLLGVFLVITKGHFETLMTMQFNHGDKLIFCGVIAWSLYTYFSQSISQWMPVIPYTFISMLCGVIVISAMCLVSENVHPFTELVGSNLLDISQVIYIGVFGTVAAYLLWLNGISRLGANNAVLFFNLVPIFSVLTSLTLGQEVTPLQLAGMALVIMGLLLPHIWSLKSKYMRKIAGVV